MLHLIAKEYGKRPSEIVGIADEWAAYDFDAAVLAIGADEMSPDRDKRRRPGAAQLARQGR